MKQYVTADLHFGHANIIKYCKRPFKSLAEMNRTIITNFNTILKDDDMIYHIGDWCFRNSPGGKKGEGSQNKALTYLKKLKGFWVLLKGNHDRNNSLKTKMISCVVEFAHVKMWLTHRPQDANPDYEINLVGHVHGAWKIQRLTKNSIMYNVGVDVHNFKPITLDQVITDVNRFKREEKNGKKRTNKQEGSSDSKKRDKPQKK